MKGKDKIGKGPTAGKGEVDDGEVRIHGRYRYSITMVLFFLLCVVVVLIIIGFSGWIETYLDFTSEADPEGGWINEILGLWGFLAIIVIGTGYFYLVEDMEFELIFADDGIDYTGKLPMRADRKVVLTYGEIDSLSFERPDEDAFFQRGHRLHVRNTTKPFSVLDPRFIRVWSRGLMQKDLLMMCEMLNDLLDAGKLGEGKCEIVSDTLSIFGGTNEGLRDKLQKGFDSGEIRGRAAENKRIET